MKLHIKSPSTQIPQGESSDLDFNLDVFGRTLRFALSVDSQRAGLADLVPPARTLCAEILNAAIKATTDRGAGVTCSKGCSSCCKYLVPVSSAEAFAILDEIFAMPVSKRNPLLRGALAAAKYILDKNAPAQHKSSPIFNDAECAMNSKISKWYAGLNLTCPFLANRSCTIYDIRPLACREHLVTCPALMCESTSPEIPNRVTLPVSVAKVLMQVEAILQNSISEVLILPLMVPYAEANASLRNRTWPAMLMARIFIETVQSELAEFSAKCKRAISSYSPPRRKPPTAAGITPIRSAGN